MQVQAHVRVFIAELLDDFGQYIARLGMGGADGEAAPALVPQFGGEIPDGLGLLEDLQRPLDDLLARRGDPGEVASFAGEDLKAQLILQQLDLLADSGLRGMQLLGGRRYVKSTLGHGRQVAQLVQFHRTLSP